GRRTSFVHVEVDPVPSADPIAAQLRERLGSVVSATDDYLAMRAQLARLVEELRTRPLHPPWNADVDEIAAFLEWLGQKNFVFLGYREYQFAGQGPERTAVLRSGTGLGILRNAQRSSYATARPLPEDLRRRLSEPPLLLVSKTNAESPI